MAVAQARELVGPDRLIGLSTHTPAQIDAANRADVDYIGVGPVHETPTKPGRPAVGLALVRYAARHAASRSSRSAGSTSPTPTRSPRRAPDGSRSCAR